MNKLTAILATGVLALHSVSVSAASSNDPTSGLFYPANDPEPDFMEGYVCYGDLENNENPPILLIPGTTLTPELNFSWNWFRDLDAQGRAYCTITLGEDQGMTDIQETAEHYVANAIRETHQRSGNRRIQILGFSQGGMISRWALKYFPDTRAMVDDLVGLAPSNHGGLPVRALCVPNCAPAIWQQRDDSNFMAALNSGQETYPEIDYTVTYTYTDEFIAPNLPPEPISALEGGTNVANIAIQDICPASISEHLAMGSYDPVAYAVAMDAINHPGPAVPSRISPAECLQVFQPGVNPLTFAIDFAAMDAEVTEQLLVYPKVDAEPPLKCYTDPNGC